MNSAPAADDDWRRLAACMGMDVNLFFTADIIGIAKAKSVCARCFVREQCLDYSLQAEIPHGVFGGLNENERRRLQRARAFVRPASGL
ncbi:WhiB family transcriptional regulator [Phytoactinopolyspora endophytica]|uniref:WhiB family transcriptional regulator n=1 Tax=Phytoactinopolyspora endophytica TaxID=1642495 RepID=UPI00101C1C3E|nr:WhiB family transcriptional regulator [Phytoactinopolyspora endophytica]